MPPRKASSRMASTRGKRTKATGSSYRGKNNNSSSSSSSKPTSENPPSSANTDDSLAKLGSQMTGLRVHSQSAATTSSFSSPTKADRRKFVDDVEPPMGLSEDQIAPLLYNFDLETELRITRFQSALAAKQQESRTASAARIQRVSRNVRKLPIATFLGDYGGDANLALTALGPTGSTSSTTSDDPTTHPSSSSSAVQPHWASAPPGPVASSSSGGLGGANEDWTAFIAQVHAAGLKRAASPTKSSSERIGLPISSRTPSPTRASRLNNVPGRSVRTGETVKFTSINGTPLHGLVLPDGRIKSLHCAAEPTSPVPPQEDQHSPWDPGQEGIAQRLAAARQALGSSSSSIQLPSSPAPRRPGRVAAAAAALDRQASISSSRRPPASPGSGRVNPPSSPHIVRTRSPSRTGTGTETGTGTGTGTGTDKAQTIYLSTGRSIDPSITSPSDLNTLRIPAAERARVRNQIAQWHMEQSQRWAA